VLRPSRFSTQRKARVQSVPGTNRGQVNAPPLSEGESAREVRFAKRDACMSRCSEGRVKNDDNLNWSDQLIVVVSTKS